MKKWIFATIAVCFIFAGLTAWSQETPKPKMQIVEPSYNAGEMYKTNKKIQHDFIIKNIGNAELQIINARPGCGCTVTQFDKVIAPGAEGKVQASVDISHFKGQIEKGIDLQTNDPEQARARLTVKANIKTVVEVSPADQVRFTVSKGEAKKSDYQLTTTYEKPIKITNAKIDSEFFTVDLVPPDAGAAKPEYKMTVGVKDTVPIGTQVANVELTLQDAPVPTMTIPVTAIVRGAITASPSMVSIQIKRFPEEVTNTSTVNMRQQPDLSAPVVTKLLPGKQLRVIAHRDDWYQVITESKPPAEPQPAKATMSMPRNGTEGTQIGWVMSKLVKVSKQPESNTNQTVSILKSTGNFKILEYTSTNPEVKLELDPSQQESQKFTLKVSLTNPDQIKANMKPGAILIKTNDTEQPEIKIPLYVIVS
ncbi:DUF1573 domain-containing protein [bacterium]|nr:DUF1573 domain-containing protein [bacterium]